MIDLSKLQKKSKDFSQALLANDLYTSILLALVFIIVGVLLAYENNKVVPLNSLNLVHYYSETHNPLNFLAEWDGPDYLDISRFGYTSLAQTNFFPLYPLLIRAVTVIVRSALDSALLVSWVSLVGALFYYLKIVKRLFHISHNNEAIRAVLLFLVFPTSVFLLATYTESLFAFFALGSVYAALRKRWQLAGSFGFLATLTHVNGIFLIVLTSLILLEEGVKLKDVAQSAALSAMGLIVYMFFLLDQFHKPLAFVTAQREHGWLESHYSSFTGELSIISITLIVLIIVGVFYYWRTRKSFSIYLLCYLLILLIGGQVGGFNRYALMAFPVQFMLYNWTRNRPALYAAVLAISSVLCAHFLFQYAGGYVGG
jgi:hypothetical protein